LQAQRRRLKIPLKKFRIECFQSRLASFNKTPRSCTFDLALSDEIAMQNDRLRGTVAVGPIATGRSLRKFRESHGFIGQIPSGYVWVGTWSSAREVDKRETSDTSPRPILLLSWSSQPRLIGLEAPEAMKLFEVS